MTDNAKVFTARFCPGPGPVLFDKICIDKGITHILTAPRSPTTTGKIERWHKTLPREFLDGKVFASIEDAQAQLDVWVYHRPSRSPATAGWCRSITALCSWQRMLAGTPSTSRPPGSSRSTREPSLPQTSPSGWPAAYE